MDRFPDALENSYRKPLRSGKLVSPGREIGFEFSGRQIAERRVKPPLVIQFFEKLADRSFRFMQVPIFITQTSSYFSVFMNDSQVALSHGLPLRDMLIAIAFALSRSVYSLLAYCVPRS